jgi:hypothetical protein
MEMSKPSRMYLGAIVAATIVYFALSTAAQSILYDAIGLSAAGAMLIGAWRYRPVPRAAWILLGVGVLSHAGGDIVFGTSQPVPSPADMLYLSSYPLFVLGIIGLISSKADEREGSHLISAVAYSLAVGILAWLFLIAPAGHQHGIGAVTLGVSIGYPVMDVVLILLVLKAVGSEGMRADIGRLLCVGLLLMFVGDAGYAMQGFGVAYSVGGALDVMWLLSYGFLGAALLQPAPRTAYWEPISPRAVEHHAVSREMRSTVLQAVRYRVLVGWTGRILALCSAIVFLAGAAWSSAELVTLAGAYGTMGVLMLIASSVRSATVSVKRPATSVARSRAMSGSGA